MSKFLDKDSHIIDMHSEWIKDSEMRVRVRHFGKSNRLMIDVTEMTAGRTSKERALKVARDTARKVGTTGVDCVKLLDFETTRKAQRLTGEQVITHIRQSSFAFEGFAK